MFEATLPEVYPWTEQVVQYADAEPPAEPGITYYAGDMSHAYPGLPPIDCLLYWVPTTSGDRLRIVGILNHYPVDYPPHERAGNVNVWVRRSHQRQGIGTALVREADRRWGVNPNQQRFTVDGVRLAEALTRKVT